MSDSEMKGFQWKENQEIWGEMMNWRCASKLCLPRVSSSLKHRTESKELERSWKWNLLFYWVWWHTPVIPAFRRLRQNNGEFGQLGLYSEFEASLGCVACGEGEHLVTLEPSHPIWKVWGFTANNLDGIPTKRYKHLKTFYKTIKHCFSTADWYLLWNSCGILTVCS